MEFLPLVSKVILVISIILIVMPLFSGQLRHLSEKLEQRKAEKHPEYARQKNVLDHYCPACKTKLDTKQIINKHCSTCGSPLVENNIRSIMLLLGSVLLILQMILQFDGNGPYTGLMTIAGFVLIFTALSMQRFKKY